MERHEGRKPEDRRGVLSTAVLVGLLTGVIAGAAVAVTFDLHVGREVTATARDESPTCDEARTAASELKSLVVQCANELTMCALLCDPSPTPSAPRSSRGGA